MNVEIPELSEPAPETALRARLSNLHGLLVLSMLMTESGDERHILQLATTAVPSLGRCRLQGAYLLGAGWRMTNGPCAQADFVLTSRRSLRFSATLVGQ